MTNTARRVAITQRFVDDDTMRYLREHDCDVRVADLPPGQADGNLSIDQLKQALEGASGWIVGHAHVTRDLMSALPDLQIISRRGVGYERVDVQAAAELGRVVTIAAGGNDATVADHVIGLMLAVGRRFRESHDGMVGGDWSILVGTDLFEKTVGVIGLGRIGRSLIQRLRGFDCEILVCTPHPDETYAIQTGVRYVDLPELLAQSDYISIHAPLNDHTRFMIRAETLAAMKPNAIVINTARGGLVDDRDLLNAIKSKRILGAGLDVFVSENDPSYRPVTAELLSLPQVVATPHAGASTTEGLARTSLIAAQCVVAVLDGEDPPGGCVVADGRIK